MSTVITGQGGFAFVHLAALKGALAMELRGMKRRGRSAYSICKSEYGLKGSRESVYTQMCDLVELSIAERQ